MTWKLYYENGSNNNVELVQINNKQDYNYSLPGFEYSMFVLITNPFRCYESTFYFRYDE